MEINKESLQSCDAHTKKSFFWGGLVSRWMRSWAASPFIKGVPKISAQRQSERKWREPQREHRKALKVESINQRWPFFFGWLTKSSHFWEAKKQKKDVKMKRPRLALLTCFVLCLYLGTDELFIESGKNFPPVSFLGVSKRVCLTRFWRTYLFFLYFCEPAEADPPQCQILHPPDWMSPASQNGKSQFQSNLTRATATPYPSKRFTWQSTNKESWKLWQLKAVLFLLERLKRRKKNTRIIVTLETFLHDWGRREHPVFSHCRLLSLQESCILHTRWGSVAMSEPEG